MALHPRTVITERLFQFLLRVLFFSLLCLKLFGIKLFLSNLSELLLLCSLDCNLGVQHFPCRVHAFLVCFLSFFKFFACHPHLFFDILLNHVNDGQDTSAFALSSSIAAGPTHLRWFVRVVRVHGSTFWRIFFSR